MGRSLRNIWVTAGTIASAFILCTAPVSAQVGANGGPERMQGRTDTIASAAPQQRLALPPPEAMIILIRSTLVALSQANQTGNYTVLNQLGSTNFRKTNTPERLKQIFAPFRTNNIDLSLVVFITPQLTEAPRFEGGRLRLIGFFPTNPMRVTFDLMFEPDGGQWRLFGLGVDLEQASVPSVQSPKPLRSAPSPARSDSR